MSITHVVGVYGGYQWWVGVILHVVWWVGVIVYVWWVGVILCMGIIVYVGG